MKNFDAHTAHRQWRTYAFPLRGNCSLASTQHLCPISVGSRRRQASDASVAYDASMTGAHHSHQNLILAENWKYVSPRKYRSSSEAVLFSFHILAMNKKARADWRTVQKSKTQKKREKLQALQPRIQETRKFFKMQAFWTYRKWTNYWRWHFWLRWGGCGCKSKFITQLVFLGV